MNRSSRPDVRNPILGLDEAAAIAALPAESKAALRALLIGLSKQCRANAEKAWRTHKAPMAAYWKSNAVWSRHIAAALATVKESA
jgi:hypothetical protein